MGCCPRGGVFVETESQLLLHVVLFLFAEVKAAAQLTFMSFSEETVVAHVVVGPVSF